MLQGVIWGLLLALFFFGGLWLTVRRIPFAKKPGRMLLVSALIRFPVTLACFWIALQHGLLTFGIAFLFFLLTRFLFIRIIPQSHRGNVHAN
ncbi:N-ATPase subunit AtpR [Desulfogranum japonicum]|uniref:N-ATPase subunit AtpR n=1 Tax=Desulfogranum japonicum TaxID=231447 RepID=UPI0038BCAD0F